LHDFAIRVEWLYITAEGNPHSASNWITEELGNAFLKVLGEGEEL